MDGTAFDIAMANHDPSAFETAARDVGFLSGNHDRPEAFREAFADWVPFAQDHLSFVEPLDDATLVGLDSNLPGGRGGVDDAKLDWLSDTLSSAQAPVILALHHPPFPTHTPHLDRAAFVGADALASCLKGGQVNRIIAGHSHRGIQSLWAGIPASNCTDIGHGLTLSLSGTTPHRPVDAAPGYELHQLRLGSIVSYQILTRLHPILATITNGKRLLSRSGSLHYGYRTCYCSTERPSAPPAENRSSPYNHAAFGCRGSHREHKNWLQLRRISVSPTY